MSPSLTIRKEILGLDSVSRYNFYLLCSVNPFKMV